MSDHFQPAGATPGEDLSGLRLSHLTTRAARNIAEADAISQAYNTHIFRARRKTPGSGWLTDTLLRQVHKDMLGPIWTWAGTYRSTALNLGVEPHLISEHIHALCGDFRYWDSTECTMPPLEIAARLQNRLTKIHPFKNGNGRHARLITDMFFHSRRLPVPQWPQIHLMEQGHVVRETYISAMKRADEGDFSQLMQFMNDCLPAPRRTPAPSA